MAREISLYGQKYQLTDGVENFAKIKQEFGQLADKMQESYEQELKNKCNSMRAIVENSYDIAEKYFAQARDLVLSRLAQNEIYTVSNEDIESIAYECNVLTAFDDTMSTIESRYYDVMERAQEARDYREARKNSRARFVGGGFGISGAISGSMKAGLLNTATGMGHSVFNSFGNARTERQKQECLDEMHRFAPILLSGSFKTTISNYYIVMVAVLDKYNIVTIDWPSQENETQAKAILENLKAGRIPKDKINDVLYKLVTLAPFKVNNYYFILENYGDLKGELEQFGVAHGIDVKTIKSSIIEQLFYEDIEDAFSLYKREKSVYKFESDLASIQSGINKQKKKLGLTTVIPCEEKIGKEMKDLSSKYKKVEGVVFKSIEEARKAQNDIDIFYRCLRDNGFESANIKDKIAEIDFKTNIVTANLDERLEKLSLLKNDKELGKRISNSFKTRGFSLSIKDDEYTFADKVFICGVTSGFQKQTEIARRLADIPSTEKIFIMFMCEEEFGDQVSWWVLTSDNLYTFESDEDEVEDKKAISIFDIVSIRADKKGNLITRIENGVDQTAHLELDEACSENTVCESLTRAISETYNMVSLFANRSSKPKKVNKKSGIAALDLKKIKKDEYWQWAVSEFEGVKEHACINDNSPEFKVLLSKAKSFWNCDFIDETVYFVMVDSSIGSSIVLTSVRCYAFGKVDSTQQGFVFPIEAVSAFNKSVTDKEYNLFFDVDYFCENYFNCHDGFVCFNTVHFNMFNIPAKAGELICRTLTSMLSQMRKPIEEKLERAKYYTEAISDAGNSEQISKILEDLESDTKLDGDDKEEFRLKAQQKLDKYNNAEANKLALEQLVRNMRRDDLEAINIALNQILQNALYDESDEKAIIELIKMQLKLGDKLYFKELNNFFDKNYDAHLLSGKPVYMAKKDVKEAAKEMCHFFTQIQLTLEQDEIPLILYKNGSQYRRMASAIPNVEEGLFTNKRLIVYITKIDVRSYALNDLRISADDIRGDFIRDRNDKVIPFDFPYIKVEEIADKTYKGILRRNLGNNEQDIVARELSTFVTKVYQSTCEMNKMREIISKLPTEGEALKSFSKEKLEKEHSEWTSKAKYGSKVSDYLALVEEALGKLYKEEARVLCTDLESMPISELEALRLKFNKEFPNSRCASMIAEEKKSIEAEIQRKKDIATREEIAEKMTRVTSFTREELDCEYDRWFDYAGNVTEVEVYKESIWEVIEKVYKKEAGEMCSTLDSLTVDETKQLLNQLENTFKRKELIQDEIHLVENALVGKQEIEIKEWMPANIQELPEVEVLSLTERLNSNDYNADLITKFMKPLLDRKKQLIIEKVNRLIDFIRQKTTLVYQNVNIQFVFQESSFKAEQATNNVLVCLLGNPRLSKQCNICLEGFESGAGPIKWGDISCFESKKKLFGQFLVCKYKSGNSEEIKAPVEADALEMTVQLLNSLVWYINAGGPEGKLEKQEKTSSQFWGRVNTKVAETVSTPDAVPETKTVQESKEKPVEQKVVEQKPVEQQQQTVALTIAKRSFAEVANHVNKYPATTRGSLVGMINPKFSKKVNSAIKAYAVTVKSEDVFALYDDTVLGSAKEGFVMTMQGLIIKKNMNPVFICDYADIIGLKTVYFESFKITRLIIDTKHGSGEISGTLGDKESLVLASHINETIKFIYDLDDIPFPVSRETR